MEKGRPTRVGDTSWMLDSELPCQDNMEIFEPKAGESGREAREICNNKCIYLEPCREYALRTPSLTGIVGGLSVKERQRIRNGKSVK